VCLQSNRLTRIENLDGLLQLNQLYLSENGLTKIEGLERNVEISTLDLANNKIRVIENIECLSKLEEFWVRRRYVDVQQYHYTFYMNQFTLRPLTSHLLSACCIHLSSLGIYQTVCRHINLSDI
jgi:hypothetical protein